LHTSSFAVTAPTESLWLRHNQEIRTTLETLSSKSTKSTLNLCLQTRANRASVKWQTIGIRSTVQCPFRLKNGIGSVRQAHVTSTTGMDENIPSAISALAGAEIS
jgi:hypothetical protein